MQAYGLPRQQSSRMLALERTSVTEARLRPNGTVREPLPRESRRNVRYVGWPESGIDTSVASAPRASGGPSTDTVSRAPSRSFVAGRKAPYQLVR